MNHTHEPTLIFLKDTFGGSIRKVKMRSQKLGRKQIYTWNVYGENAINAMQKVVPFLKEKKQKTENLIKEYNID